MPPRSPARDHQNSPAPLLAVIASLCPPPPGPDDVGVRGDHGRPPRPASSTSSPTSLTNGISRSTWTNGRRSGRTTGSLTTSPVRARPARLLRLDRGAPGLQACHPLACEPEPTPARIASPSSAGRVNCGQ
jgi:hypothetical protein